MNSFEDLQARYISGERLSSEEEGRFLQWLNANPLARQKILVDEAINNQLHGMARINDEELAERFVRESVERAVASQHRQNTQVVIQTHEKDTSGSLQLSSVFASVCAATLVVVALAIAWYATTGRQQNDFGFAHIHNVKNLSWELIDDESRRLRVSSGYGEVHFENGTIAQLAAPLVVELRSSSNLFVENGSVKLDVPPAAVGFTVITPLARIVDFGTEFDVDVGETGQTETRVRSGIVIFETRYKGPSRSVPIKLTAEGLDRAIAKESSLTSDVRSVVTTADGSRGQFFGMIHADDKTVEFSTRQEFDDFQNQLTSLKNDPTQFRERWRAIVERTENNTSTRTESNEGSRIRNGSPGGRARKLLIEQLRSMQRHNPGNSQMQELLDGMILQAEEGQEKTSE